MRTIPIEVIDGNIRCAKIPVRDGVRVKSRKGSRKLNGGNADVKRNWIRAIRVPRIRRPRFRCIGGIRIEFRIIRIPISVQVRRLYLDLLLQEL